MPQTPTRPESAPYSAPADLAGGASRRGKQGQVEAAAPGARSQRRRLGGALAEPPAASSWSVGGSSAWSAWSAWSPKPTRARPAAGPVCPRQPPAPPREANPPRSVNCALVQPSANLVARFNRAVSVS